MTILLMQHRILQDAVMAEKKTANRNFPVNRRLNWLKSTAGSFYREFSDAILTAGKREK